NMMACVNCWIRKYHFYKGERMVPQCVASTVQHGGGSVTFWSCFAGSRVVDLLAGITDGWRKFFCSHRNAEHREGNELHCRLIKENKRNLSFYMIVRFT
uniref:Uncharacterized protein n=1 Tax=Neolamprologus brichardi TaxID=32507 RepID=A0A3Q4GZM6_NEOBR